MPRVQCETAYEFALRASIAFAKGMDRIDLTEVVACALRERVRVQTLRWFSALSAANSVSSDGRMNCGGGKPNEFVRDVVTSRKSPAQGKTS